MGSQSTDCVAPNEFTSALSLAANGVAIVTTSGSAGQAGLTVSSVCSVCAEPALILACVNTDNEFCKMAEANGVIAINLLTSAQANLSNVFAGFGDNPDDDRFLSGRWDSLYTGSPVLIDALVSLDCTIDSHRIHGTHTVYMGRVVAVRSNDAPALVYCQRTYGSVSPAPTVLTQK